MVEGELGLQLVEHRMVGTATLAFLLGHHKLLTQRMAEGLHLLLQTVFGHGDGKVLTDLTLAHGLTLAHAVLQQMEHHATTKADDGRTLAIGVLHVVYVLGGLDALLLDPLLDGAAQAGHVDHALPSAKQFGGLTDATFLGGRALVELRHLLERGVGHLGHQHARR